VAAGSWDDGSGSAFRSWCSQLRNFLCGSGGATGGGEAQFDWGAAVASLWPEPVAGTWLDEGPAAGAATDAGEAAGGDCGWAALLSEAAGAAGWAGVAVGRLSGATGAAAAGCAGVATGRLSLGIGGGGGGRCASESVASETSADPVSVAAGELEAGATADVVTSSELNTGQTAEF
jgi:hypothetical protein